MIKIDEVRFKEEIEPDTFYIYPSNDISGAFVVKGEHLYDWLNNQLNDFELVAVSYVTTFAILSKVFKPDYLVKAIENWDGEVNMDDLVVIGYQLSGRKIKRILPNSFIHDTLRKFVQD